jgi:hypothetical protein
MGLRYAFIFLAVFWVVNSFSFVLLETGNFHFSASFPSFRRKVMSAIAAGCSRVPAANVAKQRLFSSFPPFLVVHFRQ